MQEVGLQTLYNDPEDREIKIGTHMLLALAFVPPDDVQDAFRELQPTLRDELKPVVKYFKETYITGKGSFDHWESRGASRANPIQ